MHEADTAKEASGHALRGDVHRVSGKRREKFSPIINSVYVPAMLVVVIDQLSKYFALLRFSPGDSLPLIPDVFHLTLVMNTGIAFGLFHRNPEILLALISLSIIVLLFYAPRLAEDGLRAKVAMGLILGGAVGNWIDRLRVQAVIDFLDFRIWPVFNLADTAISVGVGLYLLKIIFEKGRSSPGDRNSAGNTSPL